MTVITCLMVAPNGTLISAVPIPGGRSWSSFIPVDGNVVVNANRANTTASIGNGLYCFSTVTPTTPDYSLTVVLDRTPGGTPQILDVFGRWQANGDHYYMRRTAALHVQLRVSTVALGDRLLGDFDPAGVDYDTLTLDMAADVIRVLGNGVEKLNVTNAEVGPVGSNGFIFPSSVADAAAIPQLVSFAWSSAAFVPVAGIPKAVILEEY